MTFELLLGIKEFHIPHLPNERVNIRIGIHTDWPPPMSNLCETLGAVDAFLFKDEAMTPIFCKPKLLPLKTVSVQKLDAMQKEAKSRARTEEVPPDPTPSQETKIDIWTADD